VGCAEPSTASSESFEIPFTKGPRGHLLVDVVVNGGEPVPFAVDTGAGRTVLHQGRLSSLGLEARDSDQSVSGAHQELPMGLTEVESLRFGRITLGALELATMDLSHVESAEMELFGVLGFDVLSSFDLEIDLAKETAWLYPPARSLEECGVCKGQIEVSFELIKGTHIGFEVEISDQPITAVLDTGSGRTGMNRLAAESIGIELPPTPPGHHGPALRVGELHLGGSILARDLIVGVVDLPVFEPLGVAAQPAMIIGTGALTGRRLGISYGLKRLSVD
jgi:predicted aspartyl protease